MVDLEFAVVVGAGEEAVGDAEDKAVDECVGPRMRLSMHTCCSGVNTGAGSSSAGATILTSSDGGIGRSGS